MIKQYVEQIEQLNAELTACREQNGVYLDPQQYERMKEELESLNKEKEARLLTDQKIESQMKVLLLSLQDRLRVMLKFLEKGLWRFCRSMQPSSSISC